MDAQTPKIAVIIISTGTEPFLDMEAAQKETWISHFPKIQTVWFEANSAEGARLTTRILGKILGWMQTKSYSMPKEIPGSYPVVSLFMSMRFLIGRKRGKQRSTKKSLRLGWVPFAEWAYQNGNLISRLFSTVIEKVWTGDIRFDGERARCNFPTHWFMLAPLYLLKYRFALRELEADYFLFTTATCYVNGDRLQEDLAPMPRSGFYGGNVMTMSGHPFVAGNSLILSPDVISRVLQHSRHYRLDIPDDVALGRLCHDFDIARPVHFPTETLPFGARVPTDLSPGFESRHLVRCKTEMVSRDSASVRKLMLDVHGYSVSIQEKSEPE